MAVLLEKRNISILFLGFVIMVFRNRKIEKYPFVYIIILKENLYFREKRMKIISYFYI